MDDGASAAPFDAPAPVGAAARSEAAMSAYDLPRPEAFPEPFRSPRTLGALTVVLGGIYTVIQADLLGGVWGAARTTLPFELVEGVLSFAMPVVGIMFFWGVARNLDAFGVQGRTFGNVWAAVSWLIPFVNLVLPYLVVRELWHASDPDVKTPRGWAGTTFPALLPAWWLVWVLATAVAPIATFLVPWRTLADAEAARIAVLAGDLTLALAWLLWVLVAHAFTTRQEAKARALGLL